MNPQGEAFFTQRAASVGQRLGEEGQAVAAAFGEGAVGVDDEHVEWSDVLKRPDQQAVRPMRFAARRALAVRPVANGCDGVGGPC
nr:hypothetical protein [Tanacetum cinerariifolium]